MHVAVQHIHTQVDQMIYICITWLYKCVEASGSMCGKLWFGSEQDIENILDCFKCGNSFAA